MINSVELQPLYERSSGTAVLSASIGGLERMEWLGKEGLTTRTNIRHPATGEEEWEHEVGWNPTWQGVRAHVQTSAAGAQAKDGRTLLTRRSTSWRGSV